MKTTFEKLSLFNEFASKYLQENKDDKLTYAIKKVGKSIEKIFQKEGDLIREQEEDARIDNCSVDEKGNILRDEKGQLVYTKDALKKLHGDIRKIHREVIQSRETAEYEIETYVATVIPELTTEQQEAFSGIVIPELVEA